MIIAFFGTDDDRSYLPRFQQIVGTHAVKAAMRPEEYLTGIAAKVKANKVDAIITTCTTTMLTLLKTQPDFRRPVTKIGREKNLSLDDYAGSCFVIPGAKLGVEWDVRVLILNPLAHLVRTPEGSFVFKRFISKITKPESWFPQTKFTWEVWKPSTSASLLAHFSQATLLAVDIETYVDDPLRRIHCVGYCGLFADGSTHTVVVPFKDMLAHQFVRQLNASRPPKIMQNGMYDNLYFLRFNVPCYNYIYDTQHLFHGWYSELPKRLDFITAFAIRDIRYWKDDAKTGGEWELFEYNARDCWATLMAWSSLMLEVPEWAITNYLLEFPLVFPCLHMEADGLSLDKDKFNKAKLEAEIKLGVEKAKLQAWFGDKFNPASPDQCKRLLTVLGMGIVESADAKAMTACAAVHPFNELIISAVLAYRKQAKLLSTYFQWDKFWNDRLYYKTNPAGTDTGRLASTESSFWCGLQIQNIPQGKAVKSWIVVDAGWDALAEGDYSQSEARCVGYMSGCQALIDLVESDKDYHSWNAHKFFGVAYEDVTKDLRNLSKRVNHGSNYNMGASVLLDTMGPKAVAQARLLLKLPASWTLIQVCAYLLKTYEETYPEVKRDWYDDLKRTIKMTKKLVSQLGWTRHFFSDPTANKPALNAAVAHGPQNLSVGIINGAFYQIWHDTVYGDLVGKVRIKAQIHDSIFFAYRGEETPEIVRRRMQREIPVKDIKGVTRTMIIPPDMNCGERYWGDLK
jgi:DNA polymerase I-like protein with 3'-5' exonuclease and polymerase domains